MSLKVAIASFAHTHAAGYAYLLAGMPDVEVLSADPDGASAPDAGPRGAAFAEQLGVPYVDSYDELFAWGPDAVVVTSENAGHRALVERAAAAGVHVLCEKPLATEVEDGEAMLAACEAAGSILMVAYPVRFAPSYLRLREVEGSVWDPTSIMEYPFGPGLIVEPAAYGAAGVHPPGTISEADKQYVLGWYPTLGDVAPPTLDPFESVPLSLKPGEQADFTLSPTATRQYELGTFGASDTVLVLFEEVGGELRYVAGDDDSGEDRNSHLTGKLFQGRHYVLRVRLYYTWASGQTAIMYW